MPNYDKMIQKEKEQYAWNEFKEAVHKCMKLQFDEKQLVGYVQLKHINIKGGVKGEGDIVL